MSANGNQVGGTHYTGDYQPWDFAYDALGGDGCLLNINKYVVRARKKNGVEDLKKAGHYLEKLVELRNSGRALQPRLLSEDAANALLDRYAQANRLALIEQEFILALTLGKLGVAAMILQEMIRDFAP